MNKGHFVCFCVHRRCLTAASAYKRWTRLILGFHGCVQRQIMSLFVVRTREEVAEAFGHRGRKQGLEVKGLTILALLVLLLNAASLLRDGLEQVFGPVGKGSG